MANGIWSTSKEPTRGGAMGRAFNLNAETFYLNERAGPRTISKWGKDDEIGNANLITDKSVLNAAKIIKTGKVYRDRKSVV